MPKITMPTQLAEIIALHREMFGGLQMLADEAPDGDAAQPTPAEPEGAPADNDDAIDWKAESRKWEARAKENKDAAEKLQQLEDAKKSELEKSTERASRLEADLGAMEARLMRAEIALEKGLTLKQAARLVGATREELAADADEMLTELRPAPTPRPGFRLPDPVDDGVSADPDSVARAFLGV